jgi:hypothetical protein
MVIVFLKKKLNSYKGPPKFLLKFRQNFPYTEKSQVIDKQHVTLLLTIIQS